MKPAWTLPRQGYTVLLTAAVLCIVAIVSLAQAVSRDLNLLESANSDNVQWTLSQAEVEYLEFERALDHGLAQGAIDPATIRLEFDIFYSRIVTLETGSLFADLRKTPEFADAMAPIRGFLDAQVGLIDRLEQASDAEIRALERASEAIAPVVRRLANSGLSYFAELSDTRRESIAVSLRRLALVTTSLIAALALLAYYSHRVGRQNLRSRIELQTAYARMNTVVNTSLDAVIVSDAQGRILDFNTAAENIFGYRFADLEGKKLGDYLLPPHLRDAHHAGVKRMRDTGEKRVIGHGRVKLEAMRANGEVFPCELALESAGHDKDMIIIGFVRDISAQVAAETELVEARDRALAGEKAKSDFLAVMTHEIRTPLNGILGNLSLLEDTKLNKQQARYAQNMDISGRQLMQHVDAVLDIARFEAGQISTQVAPTHLGHLIQDIVDGQSGAAEARGNTLQWAWEGPAVDWVQADAGRLAQVLLNLVGNAIKFTQDGRISIEAEQVSNQSDPTRTEVEFRIIDTGIGIAEADQARVFEDFQTVDASYQRSSGGTGLGLGIVRRLIKAMDGELGLESSPNEGSVFWVRVPLVRAQAPDAPLRDRSVGHGAQSLNILVVEDNEINLHLLRDRLHLMGHTVHVARNGLEGVQAADARRFDLILMDISMPVMDGLEACRRIRASDGASAQVPIVALSANVLPEMRGRIVQAGMSGFLGKPLQQAELQAVLNAAGSGAIPVTDLSPTTDTPDDDVLAALRGRFEAEVSELLDWLSPPLPQDREQIAARCHMVAGSAAAFDHLALRDALVQVEMRAQSGATDSDLLQDIQAARDTWLAR